ncbi:hypothetical protein Tco_1155791 [Tanacetum coccineum]
MKNANPPPTNNHPVLPAALHAQIDQELHTNMNNLESDDEAVDTPFVSPFPHSDNDSDDGEVLNELIEYENARTRRERIINSFDGDDLAFECMIGFRKFTAYLDPFLPMNIISRKAYNTIMVKGLEGTGKNLVAIVKDVYVFVGSPEYQVNESMKEWHLRGHVSIPEVIFDKKNLGRSYDVFIGRFNQLSHVSSPLLSKPGEY